MTPNQPARQSEMDRAYRRDYADQRKMRELREAIAKYLADPPSCERGAGLEELQALSVRLAAAEAYVASTTKAAS